MEEHLARAEWQGHPWGHLCIASPSEPPHQLPTCLMVSQSLLRLTLWRAWDLIQGNCFQGLSLMEEETGTPLQGCQPSSRIAAENRGPDFLSPSLNSLYWVLSNAFSYFIASFRVLAMQLLLGISAPVPPTTPPSRPQLQPFKAQRTTYKPNFPLGPSVLLSLSVNTIDYRKHFMGSFTNFLLHSLAPSLPSLYCCSGGGSQDVSQAPCHVLHPEPSSFIVNGDAIWILLVLVLQMEAM